MATKKKGLLAAAGNAGGVESGPFILGGIDQTQTPETHVWSSGNSVTLGQALWFKSDGTKMWIYGTAGTTSDYIYQYDLSTAWDTNSYTYSTRLYAGPISSTQRAFFFSDNGENFYWNYGYFTSQVYWKSLASVDAFDISATTTGGTSIVDNVAWFYVKPDGTRTWHTNFGSRLYTNSNATTWQPVTTEYSTNYEDLGYTFTKFQFADSGSMLFVYDDDNDALVRYTLGTAYDISTLNFEERVVISDMKTNGITTCFFVSTDGDYLFYSNSSGVLSRISFE